ncbi:SRPBCC domain-containing protein [Microbacterium capsulatum]|uniref:SRPBCC domain-containing protein n=1 Tax=Microbacterium capsulatum TaxID=3041921 RepID=A0ABU0XE60_9MICO|nr:SRPBCC domain-containing protein [Microbacterium sp. ASV81]MDQ4212898.1 SRPBCC domain-containing protein [Microbacterium sp. ASV81]
MFTANVDRTFALDIETMWELWTSAEHLSAWHRPSLEFGPTLATVDARVGGRYRLEMLDPAGEVHAVGGIYVEVDRPNRLLFTWQWDGSDNESLVEVSFTAVDDGTAVSIVHTKLVDQADADLHAEGWIGCLQSIAVLY